MKLIGISGSKGSGKDTLAMAIMKHAPYTKYSMADPIRAVGRIMQFTEEEMLDPVLKELPAKFLNIPWRKFAQWFGTDVMRDQACLFFPHELPIWIRLAERHFDNNFNHHFVIPDIRFDNEAEMVKRRNGVVILVKGSNTVLDPHKSEMGISPHLVDVTISNDSTIEHLNNVAEIMVRAGIFDV